MVGTTKVKQAPPRGKKVKAVSSGRSRIEVAQGAVRACFLGLAGATSENEAFTDIAGRIVGALSLLTGSVLPRWKDLTPIEKLVLEQAAAIPWITHALTFDMSDEQRQQWIAKHGNLTEGFRREVLNKVRHLFPDRPNYWLIVEPKMTRGKAAREYRDQPGLPRRFDVHMGVGLQAGDQYQRFSQLVWKRAFKLKPDNGNDLRPLDRLGRSARLRPIFRRGGWENYSRKFLRNTIWMHADVTGVRPLAASQRINKKARARYEMFRSSALEHQSFPVDLIEDLRHALPSTEMEALLRAPIKATGLRKLEQTLRMVMLKHFPHAPPKPTEPAAVLVRETWASSQ